MADLSRQNPQSIADVQRCEVMNSRLMCRFQFGKQIRALNFSGASQLTLSDEIQRLFVPPAHAMRLNVRFLAGSTVMETVIHPPETATCQIG